MNKQMDVNGLVKEARVRKDAEEDARHVMGAVPWIELAVILPIFLCVVSVLVWLLR